MMRKLFFILIGIISAGFALYFFACSTLDLFKFKVPRSGSEVPSSKRFTTYESPALIAPEV